MPFVLLFLAVGLIAIGLRGQAKAAGQLLASEFTGPDSFIQWFLAVMILGLLGYIPKVRPVSQAMLLLVIVVMLLVRGNPARAGGGFFAELEKAFQKTPAAPKPQAASFSQDAANAGFSQIAAAITPPVAPTPQNPVPLQDIPGAIGASGIMNFGFGL